MHPLTLARKLFGIISISLLAVWLAFIATFYIGRDWEGQDFWPSPGRVAAIVSTVEDASPEERPVILDALTSQDLTVRIEDLSKQVPATDPARRVDEQLIKRYAGNLGGRAFTISRHTIPVAGSSVLWTGTWTRQALEFRIGMRTGDTLILESTAPLLVSSFGLPAGIGAGLIGTVVALIALVVLYREIMPLARLARAVDRIDLAGTPITLPDVRRQSAEIRALVGAFDRLQTRLSQLLRARMAMLGGISHDVRTFATRLRLRVDSIPDESQRNRAIRDISDMILLLDDALLAARIGAGELSEELLDLSQIAGSEVEDRRSAGAPVDLHIRPEAVGTVILGDRLALRRVIANLIENAIKYGKVAHVTVSATAREVILSVDDEGPGIQPELTELLMEPFVRAEVSRSRDTGGAGLGLAIARNLIEAHGGSLKIENRSAGGARVSFQIPVFKP